MSAATADSFLQAIIAEPDDDALRMIFADWLEENGQPERGEFIRVQVELAKWCNCKSALCASCQHVQPLCRRERELLQKHGLFWLGFRPLTAQFKGEGPVSSVAVGLASKRFLDSEFYFRRGFVCRVDCRIEVWCGTECQQCRGRGKTDAAFRSDGPDWTCPACHGTGRVGAHGPALVKVAPLERVTLSDRRPAGGPGAAAPDDAYWWEELREARHEDFYTLPGGLFAWLSGHRFQNRRGPGRDGARQKFYDSSEAAQGALSDAALAWAHSVNRVC